MKIQVDRTGSVEAFRNIIAKMQADKTIGSLLILACDGNSFSPEMIDADLKKADKPIFGGIFPEIIYKKEKLEKGIIIAGLSKKSEVYIIPNLSDMQVDYEKIIDEKIPDLGKTKTMFVLVDGFAHRISALIDGLFNIFGLEVNYIGGGAGSLSMRQKPCLFTNEGLVQDSAILALTDIESGVGVSHGWNEISGPYKVTEADRNIIKTLDWKPAFQVYREVVEKHLNQVFSADNFFDIAKGYPFGISKLGTEKIVRDPFSVGENNSLICVGEVPEESYVHILNGNISSLVNAAKKALSLSKDAFKLKRGHNTTLFMDCISRVLFLEDKFGQEIEAVYDEQIPLIGALTIGEIANSGKDYLEFYNKTAVVGVLED